MDVVVTDKKGVPIRGLTQDDLVVSEDGQRQTVVSFDAIAFVVVFDDTHFTPWRANQAKAAVASFLEKGTREGDRVSLISTAGGTWWMARMEAGRQKLIDMVKGFDGRLIPDMSPERMSDYEALRIHIYHDPIVIERVMRRYESYGLTQAMQNSRSQGSISAGTSEDPYVNGRAAEVYYQATTRMRTTLDIMERAINGLAGAKGRKSVILISEGLIGAPDGLRDADTRDVEMHDDPRAAGFRRHIDAAAVLGVGALVILVAVLAGSGRLGPLRIMPETQP